MAAEKKLHCVMKYVLDSRTYSLVVARNEHSLQGGLKAALSLNVDYAASKDSRKFVSGYGTFVYGELVCRCSKLQRSARLASSKA